MPFPKKNPFAAKFGKKKKAKHKGKRKGRAILARGMSTKMMPPMGGGMPPGGMMPGGGMMPPPMGGAGIV